MSVCRDATAADIPAVADLEARSFAVDGWSRGMLADELGRPGGIFVVAESSGVPVGMAIGFAVLDELHVLHVAVDPGMRRRGLGRILVDALEERAPGASVAWLEVRFDNHGAIAMYRGLGYEALAVRPKYYGDGCDAVVYRKPITRSVG